MSWELCVSLIALATIFALALGVIIGRCWPMRESFEDIAADTDATLDRVSKGLQEKPWIEGMYVTAAWADGCPATFKIHDTRRQAIEYLCSTWQAIEDYGPYRVGFEVHFKIGRFAVWPSEWRTSANVAEMRDRLWKLDLK